MSIVFLRNVHVHQLVAQITRKSYCSNSHCISQISEENISYIHAIVRCHTSKSSLVATPRTKFLPKSVTTKAKGKNEHFGDKRENVLIANESSLSFRNVSSMSSGVVGVMIV